MRKLATILAALLLLTACGKTVRHVGRDDWAPDVKKAINDFMDCYAGSYRSYAVFDFDNTACIFDIEHQLAVYQLETMSFAITPERLPEVLRTECDPDKWNIEDWIADISAAYGYLYRKYGPFSPDGLSLEKQALVQSDPMWLEFASKMLTLYAEVRVKESTEIAVRWILYWFDGMIREDIYDLASMSYRKFMAEESRLIEWESPVDVKSRIGRITYSFVNGVRVPENIKELMDCLNGNGIDVWICSASGMDPVLASIDAAGLYEDVTGVIAISPAVENSCITNSFDFGATAFVHGRHGGWVADSTLVVSVPPCGQGKADAIDCTLVRRYGTGPLACFMDATGDFYFCTEYSSTRLVVCFNRADRSVTDGGGLVSELAIYQRDVLGYDLQSANAAGDTFYVLQGRDENGFRSLRPSNATVRFGSDKEQLFKDEYNELQLHLMKSRNMSTREVLGTFAPRTPVPNALGVEYGFADSYAGYHSK